MNALLELEGVNTFYGPSQVLFDFSLRIGEGEIVSLLGRNGMGKTTAVRSIMGLTRAAQGSIRFNGKRIENLSTSQIAQQGIALVPEGRQIFSNLTVRENLVAFAANRIVSREPWTLERIFELFPRLSERQNNLGSRLSGGEQQMLALGRALMTNSRLTIIDEATEGLAPFVREEIWNCLALLKRSGHSILLIDKHVHKVMALADRHYIAAGGSTVWNGTSQALAADRRLWTRYLGV